MGRGNRGSSTPSEGLWPLVAARFARAGCAVKEACAASLRLALTGPFLDCAAGRAWLCSEEGLGELSGQVAGHAPIDDI
jgi:hypothetical protein